MMRPKLVILFLAFTMPTRTHACGPQEETVNDRVVFRDSTGRVLTLDELQRFTGRARWEISDEREVPVAAQELHQRGRDAGARGDYDRALSLFAEAAALAPAWPYPTYDAAFTQLLKGKFAAALEQYRHTVALAPRGFFTALTAVWTLEREEAGTLPTGTFLAYAQLEWMPDSAQRETRIRQLLSQSPDFAPAWKELALLLTDDDARQAAIDTGLAASPDPETRGILLINRAIILFNAGEQDEAVRILGSLALDPQSSSGSAGQAKAVLALLLQQRSER